MKYTYENTSAIGMPVDVFLDGVKQDTRQIIECDDEAGYIVRPVRDEDGIMIVDGKGLRTEKIFGEVVVTETLD